MFSFVYYEVSQDRMFPQLFTVRLRKIVCGLVFLISGCTRSYVSSTGTMTSPSYPGNYGNDMDCLFAVVPTSGPNALKLKINDLHLTGDGDFLEVLFF